MPSKDPSIWRADVEIARNGLAAGQVLVVSVAVRIREQLLDPGRQPETVKTSE
jgi:hypothetical protein